MKCKLTDEEITVLGNAIVENNCTIRELAKTEKLSKSSVHNYVTKNLPSINLSLAKKVQSVLEANSDDKHNRGGAATKKKYKGE